MLHGMTDYRYTVKRAQRRGNVHGSMPIRKKLRLQSKHIGKNKNNMDNIIRLPVLNPRVTAEEFFMAMADAAREHPEMFERYLVLWEPKAGTEYDRDLAATHGMDIATANTMLDFAKQDLLMGDYCREEDFR
jgi:hypothetical protein